MSMKELFERISKELVHAQATEPHFDNKDYIPVKISQDNFHELNKNEEKEDSNNSKAKMAFIDGGNIEIIGNNNFSLQLMRTYWTIYSDNKRIKNRINTYIVYINSTREKSSNNNSNNDLIYSTDIYKDSKLVENIKFNVNENNKRTKPESIIGSIRKMYEIRAAIDLCPELSQNDMIFMDGNLAVKNKREFDEMELAYETITKKGILLAGVCKTSSVATDTGSNLVAYINNISPKDKKWYYHPICKNENRMHKSEMTIARLHEKSEFAFIIDIFREQKAQISHICSNLSLNSRDPVFLGYPYGMIEADRFARCQENEKDILKTRFMQTNSRDIAKIRKILNTNKAHDVLDNIN